MSNIFLNLSNNLIFSSLAKIFAFYFSVAQSVIFVFFN